MRTLAAALLLTVLGWTSVQAQVKGSSLGTSDPRAKEILDAVSKKFKSFHTIKADFVLKISTADNKVLDSRKGSVSLKGNKYMVSVSGQEIFCDGKTLWTYNKDTKEVQVNNYTPDNATITPTRLFTNFYDKEFLYRLRGSSTFQGKPVYVIEMTPTDKSKPFFKVVAEVNKSQHTLVSTEVFEKDGHRYTYEVVKFMPNVAMIDADFTFNTKAHPGVDVVDLR